MEYLEKRYFDALKRFRLTGSLEALHEAEKLNYALMVWVRNHELGKI